MRWHKPKVTEPQATVTTGAMKGAVRGATVAVLASIATGAAVMVTALAWIPFVGGSMVVSAAAMTAWPVAGTAAGAAIGGAKAYRNKRKIDRKFEQEFRKH